MKCQAPLGFFVLGVLCAASIPALVAEAPSGHDFARWEPAIAAMEAADKANPPPKNAIMFAGSSTIRRWKTLATDFPDVPLINRGFDASEIVDSTHFADRIIFPCAPRAIFLRAGGNDLVDGKSPEQVFSDFKDFVAAVHAKLPATEVFFISWAPTVARWEQRDRENKLNGLVEGYARSTPHVHYVPAHDFVVGADGKPRADLFVADGLHFSPAGYRLLADRVRPAVLSVSKER